MRQYIIGAVPDELLEAARIDGCGEAQIFFRIVLPCVTPGLTVLGLLTFMTKWNNFLWPFVVITRPDMYTTTLVIRALADPGGLINWGGVFAASVLAVMPIIIMFLLFQKRLISNIMSGFMKF